MYKCKNGPVPLAQFSFDDFSLQNSHGHGTRNELKMRTPRYRTNTRGFCIKCSGQAIWNSLPEALTDAKTVWSLKNSLVRLWSNEYIN